MKFICYIFMYLESKKKYVKCCTYLHKHSHQVDTINNIYIRSVSFEFMANSSLAKCFYIWGTLNFQFIYLLEKKYIDSSASNSQSIKDKKSQKNGKCVNEFHNKYNELSKKGISSWLICIFLKLVTKSLNGHISKRLK